MSFYLHLFSFFSHPSSCLPPFVCLISFLSHLIFVFPFCFNSYSVSLRFPDQRVERDTNSIHASLVLIPFYLFRSVSSDLNFINIWYSSPTHLTNHKSFTNTGHTCLFDPYSYSSITSFTRFYPTTAHAVAP